MAIHGLNFNPNYAIEGTEGAELHCMESGFGNQNQIPRYYWNYAAIPPVGGKSACFS